MRVLYIKKVRRAQFAFINLFSIPAEKKRKLICFIMCCHSNVKYHLNILN